jgi:hypothetical protein
MKRLIVLLLLAGIATSIFLFVRRSLPYSDHKELLSAVISIDSIRTLGPTAVIYEKRSGKYYWFKSLTTLDQQKLDTLKSKQAKIRYMKFLQGPLENRVFRMEVDSVIVIDQVIVRE